MDKTALKPLTSEIQEALNIANGFSMVREKSKDAYNAINAFLRIAFDDLMTPEQENKLKEAQDVLHSITMESSSFKRDMYIQKWLSEKPNSPNLEELK